MRASRERSRRRLAGRAILIALLVLAAMPGYLSLEPSWRVPALRLSCGLIALAGCIRAVRWTRAAARRPESPLDAPPPTAPNAELDPRFLGLRDDVLWSTRSRRYFDVILWPRLLELAAGDLPRPAERRVLRRRGPPLRVIERLVASIEERA